MEEEDKKKYEAQQKAANKMILKAYASATGIIVTSIIVSFIVKQYFDLSDCKYLTLIGTAIPTIGTLSFLGWEIQTYGGDTPPEKLNKNLLKLTYIVGIVLVILGTKF